MEANDQRWKNMVKIDNKPVHFYPSKLHCGYNKMSNQLPKVTKTIMSPLTTMPPKKMMVAPQNQNGVAVKANPSSPPTSNAVKVDTAEKISSNTPVNQIQLSAMKNNFAAKVNVVSSLPTSVEQPKIDPKPVDKQKGAAVCYSSEKISLDDVHPYITCFLCRGYLIEATTIVECLHTYCHSCLMKHLAKEKCCPQCNMSINKSKTNIKYDATIQSIVYKLVPGLYQKELFRRRAFYKSKPEEAKLATPEERGDDTEHLILGPLDLISLSLDYAEKETLKGSESEESIQNLLKPKYLNCPAVFKVEHLKKFIVNKFHINSGKFNVEISYKVKTIVLPEHYTLMDVAYIYTWKKEAPMPFFFRIIAKNSKCDELPEVALRRSPTTTLPNVTDDSVVKKKSVSFKEDVESIEKKSESNQKTGGVVMKANNESSRKSNEYPPNAPRIETIKLKLDVSNNNVSIIKNTDSKDTLTKSEMKQKQRSEKKEKKNKHENYLPKYSIDNGKSQPKEAKKDEYEFDDEIDQQKLGFLNTFQLTAKKILDSKMNAKTDTSNSTPINNKATPIKSNEQSVNKRKSKEPVKAAPKKYKFHEMKSVGEDNKFLFTKTGDGHEITFDMSPKPLGTKPPLSKVKSDIMMAQQRADAKAKSDLKGESKNVEPASDKSVNNQQRNIPLKPKKLPMLLPKQPSPVSALPSSPSSVSPTAFVIKKPEVKNDSSPSEISVTKIHDQNHQLRVYGPKSPVKPTNKEASPQFKIPEVFAQPLPPKIKSNSLPSVTPTNILKPYGCPIKMPKNIPENMQTPYGCRTPFYVPSSPSYTPNFDPKPQFKYASPNAYASFMQSMFSPQNPGKISPPINAGTSSKVSNDNSRKRLSNDNLSSVPSKRKSPSPTKVTESDPKAILNKINFPSSLSVTLTNEQEENKKEQLRSQKQNIVNNNIEIIKISEEKDGKTGNGNQLKASSTSPTDKKPTSDKKSSDAKKPLPILPALVPNPTALLNATKLLPESKESFQRAFLESLMSVAGKQNMDKNLLGRKKEANKTSSEASEKDEKETLLTEIKTEDTSSSEQTTSTASKTSSKSSEVAQASTKKNVSLTPPPSKPSEKALMNAGKSLTPPPISQDPAAFATSAAQAMQFNMLLNAMNAAAKSSPHYSYDLANIQRTMLLETLRQNVESNALLAMHRQFQQHQQNQKNSSSPSSSPSTPTSKH